MTLHELAIKHNIKNCFIYGAIEESIMEQMASENGYERQTTFTNDLSLAEWSGGAKAVKSTYNAVKKAWLRNVKYFTEFVMCLNYKAWVWADRDNQEYAELYTDLYYKARDLALKTYKGKDAEYFWSVTD